MTAEDYRLAPLFGVRGAGAPFEVLERLGTPVLAEAARRIAALEAEARLAAETTLALGLPRQLAKKIRRLAAIAPEQLALHPGLADWDRAVRALRAAEAALEEQVWIEYQRLHDVLIAEATRELPDFLAIESEAFAQELDRLAAPVASLTDEHHGGRDREKDRALALYLQRICSKNDTVSRFGPFSWGTIVPGEGMRFHAAPGVARRRVELERWVVHGLLALVNADPEVRPEVCPRLEPHGRFEGERFVRLDEDRELALTEAERALARRCDGATPAHALGESGLAELVERGVIRWALEPLAIDASPLASLQRDVAGWREGPPRARWTARLAAIAALVERFAADPAGAERREVLGELRRLLEELGVGRREQQRTLYGARNAINENCEQAGTFTLGAASIDTMIASAWPWFELYRDAIGFAAAHAFGTLREVVAAAPRRAGSLAYSSLMRFACERGVVLDNDHWHTQVGIEAFDAIKAQLGELLGRRPDAPEWQLTAEDCAFLRRAHTFPRVDELVHASADLQIAAASEADAAAGRLEWIVAELHWAPVLLQHALYWSCPDKPVLHDAVARAMPRPFYVGDAYGQAPVHVCGEAIMDALPRATFVGAGRPKPGWPAVRPADAEVVIDDERGDIRLRAIGSGEDLGSIVRTVRLLAGMHPFFPFERGPHAPRLRLGEVIVQRRAWYLDSAALGEPRPAGVSAGFVSAIERERASRGIPRWVFVRPAPGVLRAASFSSRDKDMKPLYVDLESVVFLDILERRLRKYGQLAVTEMVPSPQHLPWTQAEGRYTFEVRTNLVPPLRR